MEWRNELAFRLRGETFSCNPCLFIDDVFDKLVIQYPACLHSELLLVILRLGSFL